ncbi:MAG: hypothetical protein FWC23_01120 [Chitinispirillia bacterium]|nr:hypothetical protein [Chitinispirillia bacterium]MCL2267777.1 hypothetical protein [Chitinispirillia bacterium]
MKRLALLLLMLLFSTAFAQGPKVPIRNVAVVETQIDEQSGAASEISKAEVRLITNEIRREAVNNLPRDRYSVMTSETVQSMGSAVLEECAEENCVISLGIKIGADYIVRGIISKFRDNYTLTVEIYETEYGMLVATAEPVRTANLEELLEKSKAVCVAMYQKFMEASQPVAAAPQQPVAPPVAAPTAATPKPEAIAAPPKSSGSSTLWLGIGLDVVGAGAIAYGFVENANAQNRIDDYNYSGARKSASARNIAYTIGIAALLGGITIHIFF